MKDFAAILRNYNVRRVTGDRYAGEWPRERFREHGIAYETAEAPKSELYLELLPAIMSGAVEILDERRLLTQLGSLERRTARGGRDAVDHAPTAHDDLANAAAGALVSVLRAHGKMPMQIFLGTPSKVHDALEGRAVATPETPPKRSLALTRFLAGR